MIEAKVVEILSAKFEEAEFRDLFIVSTKFDPGKKKLEVFIDGDEGLAIGKCAKINRFLQNFLDEENLLGEKYVLDVSSPGVGNPLQSIRQYRKNKGRTLAVTPKEGAEITGKLETITEEGITLIRKATSKKTKDQTHKIAFDQIDKAIVKISF